MDINYRSDRKVFVIYCDYYYAEEVERLLEQRRQNILKKIKLAFILAFTAFCLCSINTLAADERQSDFQSLTSEASVSEIKDTLGITARDSNLVKGNGSMTIVLENDGNKYCNFTLMGDDTSNNEVKLQPVTGFEASDMATVEFDFIFDNLKNLSGTSSMLDIYDSDSVSSAGIVIIFSDISDDGLTAKASVRFGKSRKDGITIENFKANTWYHVRIYINFANEYPADCLISDGTNTYTDKAKLASSSADLKNVDQVRFVLYGKRVLKDKTASIGFDNIKILADPIVFVESTIPSDDGTPIHPSDKVSIKLGGVVDTVTLKLDGAEIAPEKIIGSDGTYIIDIDRFGWNTEYSLTGEATDVFGNNTEISLSFKTKEQPEFNIEVAGFFDENGNKLSSITSGKLNARLIYESSRSSSTYLAMLCLYRKDNDVLELVDICAKSNTSAPAYEEISLAVDVEPYDSEYFASVYVWKMLSESILFDADSYYGNMTLK